MNNRNYIYLDYNKISLKLDSMIEAIRFENFDAIAVIVRGGLFPAVHISVRTGLPIFYLRHNENQATWIGEKPNHRKLLVVEDLAGSGHTLIDCQYFLKQEGYIFKALVVWKDTLSASTPEFIGFETTIPNESFIVPWEKAFKLNGGMQALSDELLDDYQFETTGWDMDGIFLEDVPSEVYRNGLDQALSIRDYYPLSPVQPNIGEKDFIITGRPTIDKERTSKWLLDHDLYYPLFLRDDEIEQPTAKTTASWKGNKAIAVGCCRYVESDAEQAMFMAAQFAQLEVVWWNNGNPITIQASIIQHAI
jgi:hypoxanthine phosphoribosyltransferase